MGMDIIELYNKYSNDKSSFVNEAVSKNLASDKASAGSFFDKFKKLKGGSQTSTATTSGDGGGNQQGVITKGLDMLKGLIDTQKTQSQQYDESEFTRINDFLDIINKKGQTMGGIKDVMSRVVGGLGNALVEQLKQEAQLRTDINEKVGLQGELSKGLREEMIAAYPSVLRLGYGIDQLSNMMASMMTQTGRFNVISESTIKRTAEVARAFVGDLSSMGEVIGQFEKAGVGAADAMNAIEKAGKSSLTLGLNSKKTTEELRTNLNKLNEYGFKNGIDGLNRMVQKSIEFRMSMESVKALADKVFEPDKALELSANLQVLGGAIGDLGDPIKLMYMATNNVEGLQDALIGAAGSLATYNSEQGRFEITGINLRRAKQMASELGVQYEDLAKGAIAAAERSSAATDLMMSGLVMDDKEKEFITNLSQMKGGKMVIEVPQSLSDEFQGKTEVALSELTDAQKTTLLSNQKAFEKMSAEDIARGQLSATENIQRDVAFLAATTRGQAVKAAKSAMEAAGIDLDKQAEGVKKMIDGVVKGEISGMEEVNKFIKDFVQDLSGDKTKKGKATGETKSIDVKSAEEKNKKKSESGGSSETTVNLKHSFGTVEPILDEYGRYIMKNPAAYDDMFSVDPNSYTTPPRK